MATGLRPLLPICLMFLATPSSLVSQTLPVRPEILSHVTIYERPGEYCAWPSIARTASGDLIVLFTRSDEHMGPDGAILLCRSTDNGATWQKPVVVLDTPLDDRESGLTTVRDGTILGHFWSTQHTRRSYENLPPDSYEPDVLRKWIAHVQQPQYSGAGALHGAWHALTTDGGRTWSVPVRGHDSVHGGIERADGRLVLASYRITRDSVTLHFADSATARWTDGPVIAPPNPDSIRFGEPHVLELPSGRIIMMMRATAIPYNDEDPRCVLWETYSDDGGRTWVKPYATPLWGFPPHLLLLSDGRVLCVYGYRRAPFGQRACISDDGITWRVEQEIILRDDAPNLDLGYPASVEVEPGTVLTVYYQPNVAPGTTQRMKPPDPKRTKPGILGTFWRVPARH